LGINCNPVDFLSEWGHQPLRDIEYPIDIRSDSVNDAIKRTFEADQYGDAPQEIEKIEDRKESEQCGERSSTLFLGVAILRQHLKTELLVQMNAINESYSRQHPKTRNNASPPYVDFVPKQNER